jgi:protein disulfide-isomerase
VPLLAAKVPARQGAQTLARLQQRMQQACGNQVDGACRDWLG